MLVVNKKKVQVQSQFLPVSGLIVHSAKKNVYLNKFMRQYVKIQNEQHSKEDARRNQTRKEKLNGETDEEQKWMGGSEGEMEEKEKKIKGVKIF